MSLAEFTEWLAREMPPGTVISNPRWWAPRIAARFATPQPPKPAGAVPLPDLHRELCELFYTEGSAATETGITGLATKVCAIVDAREAAANALPRELYDWMTARGLLPEPEADGSIDASEIIGALDRHENELLGAGRADADEVSDDFKSREHLFPFGLMLGSAAKFLTVHKRDSQQPGWGYEAEYSQGKGYGYASRAEAALQAVRHAFSVYHDPTAELIDQVHDLEKELAHLRSSAPLPQQPAAEGGYCADCKGSGEVMGLIQPDHTFDPQEAYDGVMTCPACNGTGATDQAEGAGREAVGVVDGPDRGGSISQTATLLRPLSSGTKLYTHPSPVADAEAVVDALIAAVVSAESFAATQCPGDDNTEVEAALETQRVAMIRRLTGADHA